MDKAPKFESERERWAYYMGPTLEHRRRRALCESEFRGLFSGGQDTDIRDMVEACALRAQKSTPFERGLAYLKDIHPKAWTILLEHGKSYRPISLKRKKPETWISQPTDGRCYANACSWLLADRNEDRGSRSTYVEGVALGSLVAPMLHAWNGRGFSKNGTDWSFYTASRWTRYFGVPFTYEEYKEIMMSLPGGKMVYRLIFHREIFESAEVSILRILKRRPRTRLVLKHRQAAPLQVSA